MMIENILKYQELDRQIRLLEKESSNMEERQIMNKMIAFVKDAQNKSSALENNAKQLVEDYNKTKSEYEKVLNNIQKLVASETQNEKTFSLINTYSSDLYMLERKLNIIITKTQEILKQFGVAKNNVIKAKQKHKECKEKYEAKVNEINPKIAKLKQEQKKLESSIDERMLTKYKNVLHDNIFPVLVPISNKLCGGCRMEIPMGKIDKLKTDGYIICEQCGRVIYNK